MCDSQSKIMKHTKSKRTEKYDLYSGENADNKSVEWAQKLDITDNDFKIAILIGSRN